MGAGSNSRLTMGGLALGRFARRYRVVVAFLSIALCLGGAYAAFHIPSSVFPRTDFPRVVILVDNGVMPANEMMAKITRPIEESMKDIPGVVNIRSATGRGSAEINVFFTWSVDMVRSELYVLGRLSGIRTTLPATAETAVHRITFSAFPIIGVSLTSRTRDLTHLWETARYDLKTRFLRIPGVARVDLVGGRAPEFHVIASEARLQAAGVGLVDLTRAVQASNLVTSTGMLEDNYTLFLTVVDGRAYDPSRIENVVVATPGGIPVRVGDVARVERGPEPVFNVVTADGVDAVLLNIRSQPDGSTLDIAAALESQLTQLRNELPPDMKLSLFYDQSLIIRDSVRSVWGAILFGLGLSILILYAFLRSIGTTLVAILVIPVTVLVTLVSMKVAGMSFNLMTLGGVAAAIGLIIDDAIVVVEAMHTRMRAGRDPTDAVEHGLGEIVRPLVGSTLTPVVVFVPLAFLDGIAGVFFRALALTMVVSLLTSLVLAVTLTPSLATWLLRTRGHESLRTNPEEGGFLLRRVIRVYECAVRAALRYRWATLGICLLVLALGFTIYRRLDTEFLPPMDEGGFVIDYFTPPGTSLTETNRQLLQAEQILRSVPEVESYSRRTGARLALAIAESNTGDFLVKLRADRSRTTDEVIAELRRRLNAALPEVNWEFPGILGDLIGDLMWAPQPIEVKLFSTDQDFLEKHAPEIEAKIKQVRGVVDTFDGLVFAGSTLSMKVRPVEAARLGITTDAIASTVKTAMLGTVATSALEGDRLLNIRVLADPSMFDRVAELRNLPIRTSDGRTLRLSQVVDVTEQPGQLELRRENLQQDVAITARLEGRDLGSAMEEIRAMLAKDTAFPPGTIAYGGLFHQQQRAFRNLLVVSGMAAVLLFTVLLVEFRSFVGPVAIVFGASLALFGTVLALWVSGTSLNVVSFLGAIIGVGIVSKNGILVIDYVERLRAEGVSLDDSLVRAGRRRLRPVLMTSMAAALGMLPMAYGVGSGADMLRPLAAAVIGALCVSVVLSLIATPVVYDALRRVVSIRRRAEGKVETRSHEDDD